LETELGQDWLGGERAGLEVLFVDSLEKKKERKRVVDGGFNILMPQSVKAWAGDMAFAFMDGISGP
jgi:hypothetical protein